MYDFLIGMEGKGKEGSVNITNFINNVLTDLKNLTNSLRPLSRTAADTNNSLINRLLLGTDGDSLEFTKAILSHLLHIVDLKGISPQIIGILGKVIAFVKIVEQGEARGEGLFQAGTYRVEMGNILYHVMDILQLLKNKFRQVQTALRIIQTTFSLIDAQLLRYANEHIFIRVYAICFDCCLNGPLIQNISLSALFALTQIIFSSHNTPASLSILEQFMEFVLNNKRYSWLKDAQFKGIVWDLIIVAVRHFPLQHVEAIADHQNITALLNNIYKHSLQKVFLHIEEGKSPKNSKKESEKSINLRKGTLADFIRYYKSFIYFSIHLAIRAYPICGEIVPFRDNLGLLKVLNELERGTKLYILLEGVTLLLIQGHNLLIEQEKAIILLDVICKVIEQLCLEAAPIDLSVDHKDLYLDKMCGDFSKINDSDHARLIRNLIIKLRKQFQKDLEGQQQEELNSARSELSQKEESSEPKPLSEKKRWQRLIRTVVSIIRYLTSLNLNETSDEQPVRKLIIEFQYWFLICPSSKTRNCILQQLLNTSTLLDTKMQAIKASQCVQLGSNLIYGYYPLLDSLGLTALLHMMAAGQTSWQDGRGFDELDEVCSMAEKLYSEQRLVHSPHSFRKTLQALVQCANTVLADLQQVKQQRKRAGKAPQERCLRLLQYTLGKLRVILQQNIEWLPQEWNFLTGFWISCCSHRSEEVQGRTMTHLAAIVPALLKGSHISEELLLSTYAELAKLKLPDISKLILQHVKLILASISSEEGVLQLFHIMRLVAEGQGKTLFEEVYQLQEMIIKEALFRVASPDKLSAVIDAVALLGNHSKEEYKTVNLVWSIFDHMKTMSVHNSLSDTLWVKLFNKIYLLAVVSSHGETRQSCIHTLTQLLAEVSTLIPSSLFQQLLTRTFLPLFLVLLGIHQKATEIENIAQAESMKVGIKNFARIMRKCKAEKMLAYRVIIKQINQRLLTYLQGRGAAASIEYCHQLCPYFQLLKTLREPDNDEQPIDCSIVSPILKQLQKVHIKFDKSSVYWRKKYEPAYLQVCQYFQP